MSLVSDVLGRKDVVVVFAYAPTGLGHLRVTNALFEGLPKDISPLLLGSHDQAIASLYRFASIHPLTRSFIEFAQSETGEDVIAGAYKLYLRNNTSLIYEQLSTILEQRLLQPKTAVIIATHSSLAHQLAAIKERLAKEKNVQVILMVCITDDTPQHIWYVEHADLIIAPSDRTRELLLQNARSVGKPLVPIRVLPYPVSPRLTTALSTLKLKKRKAQLTSESQAETHIAIPISGAAIGTHFFTNFIDRLHTLSDSYRFHIISKVAPFTEKFLSHMQRHSYVSLYTSTHDRELVEMYEEVYEKQVIALEVTKPSEQAFKSLLKPSQQGGSLLLLAEPVGRQEYDNIYFLRRHNLLPLESENTELWNRAKANETLSNKSGRQLLDEAKFWRGVRLPKSAEDAAHFVHWCLANSVLLKMAHWQSTPRNENNHAHELASNGVGLFWKAVAEFVEREFKQKAKTRS